MRKIGHSTKYFPFSPGIPWRVENGKYILPKTAKITYDQVIEDKENLIVICYGGLLESFYSFMLVEALSEHFPDKNIFWSGNGEFDEIAYINKIAEPIRSIVDKDLIKQYPVSIFFDKQDNVYINTLHNYITKDPFIITDEIRINDELILVQIFENCLLDWNKYVPKIRILSDKRFNKWKKNNSFYSNQKYIVIVPEKTSWSGHNGIECLNWSKKQVLSLAAYLRRAGINVVICSDAHKNNYNSFSNIYVAPLDISILFNLYQNAASILSKDIDFLFLALSICNSPILGYIKFSESMNNYKDFFDLEKNSRFLGANNIIYLNDELSVEEVASVVESL